MVVLETKNLTKIYGQNGVGVKYKALDRFHLTVNEGEFIGIMGPSGSGKTTLLQLLGTIDRPTHGEIWFGTQEITRFSAKEIADFRRKNLGFIFQDFQLLDFLTIKENIILPLVLEKEPVQKIDQRLMSLAQQLGIVDVLHHHPYEVSGGQKQRAAAARAIIHKPKLILADEPTGNLDSHSARSLMEALVDLNQKEKVTILMVTHDPVSASYCRRVVFIKDGKFMNEVTAGADRSDFYQRILHVMSALGGMSHDI